MADEKPITLEQAIQQVIAELDGPTPVAEVIRRVLAIRPSTAKQPEQGVRNRISKHWRKNWVYLDGKTVIPLRTVMQGARFRIVLSRLESRRGILFLDPNFRGFVKHELTPADMTLLDATGQPIPAHPIKVKLEHKTILGDYTTEVDAWEMATWFRSLKVRGGDSLLVTIEDWETGRYRLEHEPAGKRRFDEVERKNRELADLLFQALEENHDERIYDVEAVTKAYARMTDPRSYPGDHWTTVVEHDSRIKWFDLFIRYADSYTPLERILGRERAKPKALPVSTAQASQVYRFKASLKYRPGVWRRIEIQGAQTLKDLDGVLRDEFKHDFSDHMSGFWRKVRRGSAKRFREIELGTVAPFGGEGEGANTRIAAIGLAVGDEMKYVYDFGDWIEHTLTLEAITEPEAGARYPRVVAQNKPKYQDCEDCAHQGRQRRATWICHHCSAEQGRKVLVCEQCLLDNHEDHYADEIVY